MEKMLKIGFANKYYTLWQLSERLVDTPCGGCEIVKEYTYVKNISMDEDTAKNKYPGVEYDEELRGKTGSFTIYTNRKKKVEYEPNVYHFGKYEGKSFEEVGDVEYAVWFFRTCGYYHGEHERGLCLMEYLKKFGYVFTKTISEYDGDVYYRKQTPDEIKFIENAKNEHKEFVEDALAGKPINIVPAKNLDGNGNYVVKHTLNEIPDVIYHFDETKEMWYNGYYYWLPVIGGKAKRFKGKNIVINDYTVSNDNGVLTINVKNFAVAK